ncbi:diacylglycerol/lipid kinase family protein [Salinigranum sp. GCM10025319]|uniref:diacylglycerol/lipid kinase family protein n=1 Tax=Salinigranum sp. GCM10025319 TaxID=3252687 RepID=UPI003620ADF7
MSTDHRIVVRNPRSGDGKRTKRAREIATDRGYEVLDSTGSDHTVELAREAATRADVVVACGGDGTLNKTVRGVREAGALADVELGVIPAGTGNDFADNVGIRGSNTPSTSSTRATRAGSTSASPTGRRSSTPAWVG